MKNQLIFIFFALFVTQQLFLEEFKKDNKSNIITKVIYCNNYSFNNYNEVGFYNLLDNFFTDNYFSDNYQKILFLKRATSFYLGYLNNFYKIVLLKDGDNYDIEFFLRNSTIYYYNNETKKIPYIYHYSKNDTKNGGFGFSTFSNFDFFYDIYGKTRVDRYTNLETINVFGRYLPFNTKNQASYSLKKSAEEILTISKEDKEVKKWIDSLRAIYTYKERNVSSEDRPSMHSFGIAIDFIPKNNRKHIYWLWSAAFIDEWWDIKDQDKVFIPPKIIEVFESNGFCWGGRWNRFDLMHFEFRPEIAHNVDF